MNVVAYVLAGGKSSRFGSDKARAVLDGIPLVLRVAEVLRSADLDVTAVADVAEKYADLGLPTIADRRPGRGPLAGVEAALANRRDRHGEGWTILASCDLAGLKGDWVATIARRLADGSSRAVAFRADFWQPFPAAYHTALLPLVSGLLDAGQASFQRLLSATDSKSLALPLPHDWPDLVQVNSAADLAVFATRSREGTSSTDHRASNRPG